MLLFYLILAHLIGDFVLQPGKLIVWKNKSFVGVLVHVLILLSLNFFLLVPYLSYQGLLIGLFVIYLIHFVEDVLKIEFVKKFPKYEFEAFIFDQVVHFSAIFILYWYFIDLEPLLAGVEFLTYLYSFPRYIVLAISIVLASYTYDIVEYQIMRIKDNKCRYVRNYTGMLIRTLIVVLIMLSVGFMFLIKDI